uniref:Putative type III restriction enzyme n=1 Tax=viral metagenome TaxID=1070528 RepID=A0A6M3L2U2_9ZZZZ
MERVRLFCKEKGIALEEKGNTAPASYPFKRPHVEGIEFRTDQKRLLRAALIKKHGYIVSGTGTGKTLLILGLISSFPGARFLCLAHELTLLKQLSKEADKRGFNSGLYHGQDKNLGLPVIISTRQTWSRLDPKDYVDKFDGVIIDECHHMPPRGEYSKILSNMLAPIRYGVTATAPTETSDPEKFFELNGLLGPFIGEFTLEEAIEQGVLAKPKLILDMVPEHKAQRDIKGYDRVYKRLVVENDEYNRMIVDDMVKDKLEGLTSLVFVHENEHGEILLRLAESKGLHVRFIQGEVKVEDRIETKDMLDAGELDSVIANVVWMEGINIRTLGSVINAGGGKTDLRTLQKIGRGLRTAEGKEVVYLRDYYNPNHNYLVDHFARRLILYMKKGWV